MRILLKNIRILISPIVIMLFLVSAGYSLSGQKVKPVAPGDLIWSDEFDGTGEPDVLKWERQEYNRRNNDNGPDGWWSIRVKRNILTLSLLIM